MLPGGATLLVILARADSGSNVVLPRMNDSKIQLRALARDVRREPSFPQDQFGAPRLLNRAFFSIHGIAINLGVVVVRLEHRADGVVACEARQVDTGGLHELFVDPGSIPVLREVALCLAEFLEKLLFQMISKELLAEFDGASRVLNHLHGFDARKLIEEPATARVHELGVTLQLMHFE